VGNEENGYSVSVPNRTLINVTKEPSYDHIKFLKEEIMEQITEKIVEKIQDMANQKV
jgi:hypothetical protein